MTKSTITREQLEEWVAQFDEDGGCDATDMQLEALIRQSLAAMESEPVAIIDQANLDYLRSGADADVWHPEREEMGDVLLYRHAQPAPVVPDDVSIFEAAIEECKTCDSIDEHAWNHGVLAVIAKYESCRAAMLAAAPQSPGSEQATVPGKWILVSERMPIEFEAVIAFDGDQVYGEAMHSSDDGFTIDGYDPCDRVQLQNVTHWMPLPAAPQEVKGE